MPAAASPVARAGLITLGALFLAYGLIKVTVSLLLLFVSQQAKVRVVQEHPALGTWVGMDVTLAGRAIDLAILVFGAYNVIHGSVLLAQVFAPRALHRACPSCATLVTFRWQLGLYLGLGGMLTLLYLLVLYTNAPISKNLADPTDATAYRVVGLGGGLLFLAGVPLLVVLHRRDRLGPAAVAFCFAVSAALVAGTVALALTAPRHASKSAVATLAMIPANLI
jgi:hypothetical protein